MGLRTVSLTAASGPASRGASWVAPQAGTNPEEALGRREVADVVGDHAVVAVQRQLDPAAEGGPVEGGDGRVRERANSSEQVMAGAAALDRLLAPLDERKLVQIGSAGEAARLPGDHESGEITLLELGHELRERLERRSAEHVRASLARSVVHRHEGDGVDPLQAELRHGVGSPHLESRLGVPYGGLGCARRAAGRALPRRRAAAARRGRPGLPATAADPDGQCGGRSRLRAADGGSPR